VELESRDTPTPTILLRVIDSGAGMDAEMLRRIFEPFFTTKTSDRGTGLGLASVEGAVAQLGGTIRVESQPSQGSRFEVVLPRR
jgi:signal transduction histidine kinase